MNFIGSPYQPRLWSIAINKYMDCILKEKESRFCSLKKHRISFLEKSYCSQAKSKHFKANCNPFRLHNKVCKSKKKRQEINEWIGLFCCLFAIFCLSWYWVMWRRTLQKCMLIVWARSMGLTYFLWFSSCTATAAHVKQPNVFHSFLLGENALILINIFSHGIFR